MTKNYAYNKIFLSLSVLLWFTSATSQNEIIIGTGTSTSNFYPIATYYNSSSTDALYLGSEIGMAGKIEKIAYDKASGNSSEEPYIAVYMKITDKTSHGNSNYSLGEADFSQYSLVYEGYLQNNTTSGWMEITLNSPFYYYDASQNLSVLVIGNTCINSGRPQYRQTTMPERLLGAFDDGNIGCGGEVQWNSYDAFKPRLERPNIKLSFSSLNTNENKWAGLQVYKENGTLQIKSPNEPLSKVELFDIQGRIIQKSELINSKNISIDQISAKNQMLIVKITSTKNEVAVKKTLF